MIPKPKVILGYSEIFDDPIPSNRIDLIKKIPKNHLVAELSGISNKLKSKKSIFINNSLELQIELLQIYQPNIEFYNHVLTIFKKYSFSTRRGQKPKEYPLFFTRQSCLFAIEEILNDDSIIDSEEGFVIGAEENWMNLLKYILAVNSEITSLNNTDQEGEFFEKFNAWTIALNELSIETDLFFTPSRGLALINYLLQDDEFKDHILNYFKTIYNLVPEEYIYQILSILYHKNSEDSSIDFYYLAEKQFSSFFDSLSRKVKNEAPFKLINIRKNPFYNDPERENGYTLIDNMLLIEKTYSQFINDFWFDWLKNIKKTTNGKPKFNISMYKSKIGYFFEAYIADIIQSCFSNIKHTKLLMLDELLIKEKKKEIELSDLYYRQGNKVLIGEIKSGNIYDNEKYSGDIDIFYKNGKDDFFKNFGVDQLAESVINIHKYQEVDDKINTSKHTRLYPIIVVNDKVFQTPLMNHLFNKRFSELINGKVNKKKCTIYNLALIHISDLEIMWEKLVSNPKLIWKAIENHSKSKPFLPPFYREVGRSFGYKIKPEFIVELYEDLINKYAKKYSSQQSMAGHAS